MGETCTSTDLVVHIVDRADRPHDPAEAETKQKQ
jgi:hypothetical protein